MKQITLFILFFLLITLRCTKEQVSTSSHEEIEEDDNNENTENSVCSISTFCLPPSAIDTSCVKMQMEIDDILYIPVANFMCIIPNPILGYDQLWIKGSLILAKKVVTLRMPLNFPPGDYPIIPNTDFDAFYVPTIGADNFIATSGTIRTVEHDTIENYILGGFDFFAENLESPVQPNKVFTKGCFEVYY